MPNTLLRAIVFTLSLFATAAQSMPLEQQRTAFKQAEHSLNQGRIADADRLIAALTDYPLYPHLLAQRIGQNLDDDAAIQAFLDRHGHTRPAAKLRSRWLERLSARAAWAEFLRHYQATDDPALQCAYHLALYHTGRQQEAYAGAEKLWETGAALPDTCDRLFAAWQAGGGLSAEHVWRRYALAMQKGNVALLGYLQGLLPAEQRPWSEIWSRVHAHPEQMLSCDGLDPQLPVAGLIFADGIDRLAADNPPLAQTAWSLHRNRYSMDRSLAARIDRRVALALATGRYAQASAYLTELPPQNADAQTREWRLRTALYAQDWQGVLNAFETLADDEKHMAQWRYWRARAVEALGEPLAAEEGFRQVAGERDFFGFLSADRLARPYPLTDRTEPVSDMELNRLAATPAFAAVGEFRALERIGEARSEWMHALKDLPRHDQVVAAKLAQHWGWDAVALATAARADYRDDLPLRFPLGFQQPVVKNAQQQRIDPSLIFGLIRRESAFDPDAGSSVGARGLMQLMPATGEQLARQFNEKLPAANALLDPERNVRYGSAYFRSLLDRFGSHVALAAAAYNAGPNRVDRWLPALRPMPADIWVDTIPYKETRQYVSAVLTYAVIYQARLQQPGPSLSAMLPDIAPGPKAETRPDRVVSVQACEYP